MEFKKINEFVYLSNCYNYQIRVESTGKKQNSYTPYRHNPELISGWENIAFEQRPYPLYQEALTRVLKVHAEQPELAQRLDPDIILKACREVHESERYKIAGYLGTK